jgi:AcrR family transcriptional regulator
MPESGTGAIAVRRSQAQRREEAAASLLSAAMNVVASKGPQRMTMAEVGKAAGYSPGLAAHYFGNKAGLVQALVDRVGQEFADALRARRRGGGEADWLKALVDAYFEGIQALGPGARSLLVLMADAIHDESDCTASLVGFHRQTIDYVAAQLRRAKARGEVRRELGDRRAAIIVVSMLRGLLLARCLDREAFGDPAGMRREALAAIRAYLAE